MIKEFKEFALKGNMIDMAVGIIIGAAFGGVVGSLVGDVITPLLGLVTSGMDFSGLKYDLTPKVTDDAVFLKYGAFVQTCIDFLIKAFAIFLVVKGINTAKRRFEREQVATPAEAPPDIKLLTEIRDALRRG
jgi:large conductance mechanosensitive channel